jgi:hypothetical protein
LSLFESFKKIKSVVLKYYVIVFYPLIIWGLFLVINEKEDINDYLTKTYGIVFNSTTIYQKYNNKRRYKYYFNYNGTKYYGSSSAHLSKNIRVGNIYKVEFSYKNPEHSRMIFDSEYLQDVRLDKCGKVIDTVYILKSQKIQNQLKELIQKYELKNDSI